jgi:Aldehyde dehydrogenase family
VAYQTINPATGETLKTFPEITDSELEKAVSLAQTVFETDWRRRSISDRAKIISAVAATRVRVSLGRFARIGAEIDDVDRGAGGTDSIQCAVILSLAEGVDPGGNYDQRLATGHHLHHF